LLDKLMLVRVSESPDHLGPQSVGSDCRQASSTFADWQMGPAERKPTGWPKGKAGGPNDVAAVLVALKPLSSLANVCKFGRPNSSFPSCAVGVVAKGASLALDRFMPHLVPQIE